MIKTKRAKSFASHVERDRTREHQSTTVLQVLTLSYFFTTF